MSKLTDEQIDRLLPEIVNGGFTVITYGRAVARAIEAAATEPLLQRIAELEANEKVLLAQVQGHTQWREKIVKASEQAYGESAIRYKFSLTKSGKCMNTFPKEIDGRWFALVPAEDDGHIGHIARIAELERQLEEARKQMDAQKDEWLSWEAKRKALEKDAERLDYIQKNARRDPKMDGNHVWWPTTLNQAQNLKGPTIRAAIDAAMQKGQS